MAHTDTRRHWRVLRRLERLAEHNDDPLILDAWYFALLWDQEHFAHLERRRLKAARTATVTAGRAER